MRLTDLPQAIYRAINGWRIWITLLILSALILNEAVTGIRDGQSIVEALTRVSYFKMALLLFVCGVIAQAAIGVVPFAIGVIMTMIDFALRRRREWRDEGIKQGRMAEQERQRERQRAIEAIIADPVLSDAAKLQAIAAINASESDEED